MSPATIRSIRKKLVQMEINVSIGCILCLQPFFITYTTEKEMSLCLCKICLNTKMMFDILMTRAKKDGDETFQSVSSFFMAGCSCPKVQNGYYAWSCTIRLCRNCKPLMPPFLMCQDSNDIVSVDQFEKVEQEYLKLDKELK